MEGGELCFVPSLEIKVTLECAREFKSSLVRRLLFAKDFLKFSQQNSSLVYR